MDFVKLGIACVVGIIAANILEWLGFGSNGVRSGSVAAGVQGGSVSSGSWFARIQSFAASGGNIQLGIICGVICYLVIR